ncbi:hypothetical protein A8B75_18695 [Sphingomonadales bacterium EhC05]|nr:hypothetical protein A8B75_18695 [Sphingomonadales bacterium EhC05]
MVVLWSPNSVISRWVRAEATVADRNKTMMPVMIEPCELPIMFELIHTTDLVHWDGTSDDQAWAVFVTDVRQMVAKEQQLSVSELAPTSSTALHPILTSGKTDGRGFMPSLAILPFTNRSRIKDDDIFAEGMVEDIVAALSQNEVLRVLGSISTAHLKKGRFTDLAAIGKQLGVRYLLEGNVRRTGQNFRVTTQLVATATGDLVWSGQFAKPLDELQELQEELVTEVAAALDVNIQALDMERALRKPANLTAWEAVQRSVLAMRRFNTEGIQTAIEEAERAVDLAPNFAMARAILASVSANLYAVGNPDDPKKVSQIRAHAEKALEIDPESAVVLWSIANAYAHIGAPEEALPWAIKAYTIAPDNGHAAFNLGMCNAMLDQNEEAMKYLKIACSMMSGSYMQVWPKLWQSDVMIREQRLAEAESCLDECLTSDPNFLLAHFFKALLCWHDRRHEQAIGILSLLQKAGLDRRTAKRLTLRALINNSFAEEILAENQKMWAAVEARSSVIKEPKQMRE